MPNQFLLYVMTSGGAKRITVSCVSLHSNPSSFSFSQYGRASSVNSTPINNPRPRTSLIVRMFNFL